MIYKFNEEIDNIRKLQIIATVRYHLTPNRMA